MRRVNCGCDMPYGVYLDWLSDVGWDVSELREQDEDDCVMSSSSMYSGGTDVYGDGTKFGCYCEDMGIDYTYDVGEGEHYYGFVWWYGYDMGI